MCDFSLLSSSETNYPELAQTPLVKGPILYDCLPLQMLITSKGSPNYPQLLLDLAANWQFSQPPPLVQSFAVMAHRTQGDTYYSWLVIKNMCQEQLTEQICRARSGESQCRSSVLMSFCVHQPGSSPDSVV